MAECPKTHNDCSVLTLLEHARTTITAPSYQLDKLAELALRKTSEIVADAQRICSTDVCGVEKMAAVYAIADAGFKQAQEALREGQ